MKLYDYRIIPSQLEYKSAPSVDQRIAISLNNEARVITEYDRIRTVGLSQVYNDERQASSVFRPAFEISYLYSNSYIGTTNYTPFLYNLYYVNPEISIFSNVWYGYPQFFEFDFFRPNVVDQHITYESKSAYTYNWSYYVSYPYSNNYNKKLSYTLNNNNLTWTASTGIPFIIKKSTSNGDKIISFECVMPHGLKVSESVKLSFSYNNTNIFEVYSLGNDTLDSDIFVFNVYDIGYTGTTFLNNKTGVFKRVANFENPLESTSKYYIREHKILTNNDDIIITKTGFQKNAFLESKQLTLSSITPNGLTRISQKSSSNAYTITSKRDLDLSILLDNQKRPISEIFLTIINKGYSGYFNKPFGNNVGLKQGWFFNITETNNPWWDDNNIDSNSNISVSSYNDTGNTKTFYYNNNLNLGDVIDGDFCEWNDYEQVERVISPYYNKIKFNQDNFQTTTGQTTNGDGYYYRPHHSTTLKVYSDYIETGSINDVDNIPSYSFFSETDQEFRWRDIYDYGFIDELGRGVDYPYLNNAQYPFGNIIFRLSPEGINTNNYITGINVPVKPKIDGCE